MKIVGAFFGKMKILIFFLCELPLILRVDRKRQNELEIFARGTQISNLNEIGQLVQALRYATDRKLKYISLVSGIFPGKVDSVILMGVECTINPQNLIKIVAVIYEKIIIFNFFECELPLILGVGGKLKKRLEIFTRGPQLSNLKRSVDWFRLYNRRRTDRHTYRHFF